MAALRTHCLSYKQKSNSEPSHQQAASWIDPLSHVIVNFLTPLETLT